VRTFDVAGQAECSPADVVRTVVEMIAERAAGLPATCAIDTGTWRLTYAQMWSAATGLAADLRSGGVGRDDIVAVRMGAGADRIVAQLGVLLCGAGYLPVDPSLPVHRQEFLIADARCVRVLEALPHGSAAVDLAPPHPADLAYVIYTSGSTGEPKGVEVEHAALANLVRWHLRHFGTGPGERIALTAGAGFDASVWETWTTLASGATAVIPDDAVRGDPRGLRDFVLSNGVTSMFAATAIASELCGLDWPASTPLQMLHTGGEALPARPPCGLPFTLVNHYGPAESTVIATSGEVAPGEGTPTIGTPVDGVTLRIDGAELLIGGAGLARGYLRRPDLTAARFVVRDGVRWYRTGDLVQVRPDGGLEFRGRLDDQVQVRGYRVEPGEIEMCLAAHPAVRAAAVVADTDAVGSSRLRAFFVGSEPPAVIRDWLAQRLPSHLVPAEVSQTDVIPLTPNGKVDRAALRARPARVAAGRSITSQRSPLESDLVRVWSDVLGIDVGIDEPFDSCGGHSLHAMRIVSRIAELYGVELPVALFFDAVTVASLARHPLLTDTAGRPGSFSAMANEAASGEIGARPTAAQARYWFTDSYLDDPSINNVGTVFAIDGELDRESLAAVFVDVVRRHEALRTAVVATPTGPRQCTYGVDEVDVAVHDGGDPDALFAAAARIPFDLAHPPLIRVVAVRVAAGAWRMCVIAHHIAIDAMSIDVLMRDFAESYGQSAASLGIRGPMPTWAEIAATERADASTEQYRQMRQFWMASLANAPPLLDLPTDRPRPINPTLSGATVVRELPDGLIDRIDAIARAHRASRFMVTYAAIATVLSSHSGQTDLVIGTPVANRSRPAYDAMIGCFVNTLALRCDLAGAGSFAELLARVRGLALDAYANRNLPFDAVVEALGSPRPRAHHPVFTVMLVVQQPAVASAELAGGRVLHYAGELHTSAAHFDLTFVLEPRDGRACLSIRYATDLFEPATIERLASHVCRVLTAAADDPGGSVAGLLRIDESERRQVLGWGTGVPPLADIETPVYRHIETVAAAKPAAAAVVCGAEQLSYAQLNAAANRLARTLRAHGARTGVPVAVCLSRGPSAVTAMLAAAKAGGVYVPLDPAYPDDALRLRLDQVRPPIVVTDVPERLAALCPGTPFLLPATADGDASDLDGTPGPDDIAYTIFTSGSTGMPKGVTAHHRGLANVVYSKIVLFDVRPDSRVLQFVSFGFGVSITDVNMTLAAGATLVMRGPEPMSGADLVDQVNAHAVTNLVLPASVLAAVPVPAGQDAAAVMPTVRAIAVGGEACSSGLVDRWAPGRHFVNAYGPTEACVASAVGRPAAGGGVPAVGRPIPGARVYLLDDDRRLVPPGVAGELYVGGVGVTPGYLGRPDLTAERFVSDPFAAEPGCRMYRTGDRGRFTADGSIVILGRVDDQVNLRGVRIELGEVDAALAAHPAVAEAASQVQAHPIAGDQLVAFLVPAPGSEPPDVTAMRLHVAARLPEHSVPAVFTWVAALPRTPTGKLDRRSMPIVTADDVGGRPPHGPTEEILAELWVLVLSSAGVSGTSTRAFGADDDFFASGGQSILAATLMSEIRARFDVDLPLRTLFEAPTIAGLARQVEAAILAQLTEEMAGPV
jgi:amino acid adenylation domain-containing protein